MRAKQGTEQGTEQDRTVLWVPAVAEVAGVGRHVLDAVAAGIPGWRVMVLVPEGPLRDALPDSQLVTGVEFGPEHGFFRSARGVRRAAHECGADLVHSHLSWADFVCVAAMPGCPVVSTEHGVSDDPMAYATGRADVLVTTAAHRVRLQRTSAVICVSRATADVVAARWHPPKRTAIQVIPNGIDRLRASIGVATGTEPGSLSGTRPLTVGYLGRFAPEKRVDLLLRAMPTLVERFPDIQLALAGSGELEADLRALVGALRLDRHVRFDGWVDSRPWLSGIDVLCLPSVWESCSYALLEAMAMGVGVVAAPVGGNGELLPGDAVADPRDSKALADAIGLQLTDRNRRPTLPDSVPTTAGMTERIAGVYLEVVR